MRETPGMPAPHEGGVLFLGKADREESACAKAFMEANFADVSVLDAVIGDDYFSGTGWWDDWSGDYIVSYLSPLIVPERLLQRANVAAVNFHPAPPEFRGVAPASFALYEGATEYGVTCHHMAPRVDWGELIEVRRFPVLETDSVESLLTRAHARLLEMFREIMSGVAAGEALPSAEGVWREHLYTRAEIDALCKLEVDMSEIEVARRIRATTYPGMPGAYVQMWGRRFTFGEVNRRG
ncbi:MAG: hypothetical protein CVT60_05240 [Actinobacteria bacterium HGW-Actinobacteria-10]|jgi:methionyl-tRNA formyltransferase|nr:MAG: hypothetical protein CVT60_05240 [Actinobacteria bacterium HGW-Actinobacteria-10]